MGKSKALVIAIFSVILVAGCDGKLSSLSQSTCDSIKKDVISISKKQIYEITDIQPSNKTQPSTLNLPGKIVLACDGIGFTQQGEKIAINFFMTNVNGKNYIGYEADEEKAAKAAIEGVEKLFQSIKEGTQNNDANNSGN